MSGRGEPRGKAFFRRAQLERDLDDELRFHLALHEEQYGNAGLPGDEARRAALRRFGNPMALKEECRDMWTFPRVETLGQDVRFAGSGRAPQSARPSECVLQKTPGVPSGASLQLRTLVQDSQHELASAYALDALAPSEREAFEAHLAACPDCAREVAAERQLMAVLAPAASLPPDLRSHVLDLADAPRGPVDLAAYAWDEVLPGVRMYTLKEEPERGVRKVLVWARPGARYPTHRHLGDEEILVLQGALRDQRGVYRPGQVCRSRTGSVHSEEVVGSEDCVCFVVYYGGHEPVAE